MLLNPDIVEVTGAGVGFAGATGVGFDRLKAEVRGIEGFEAGADTVDVGRGADTGASVGAGLERSNKSPIVELAGGAAFVLVVDGAAEVKSPKSPKPLDMRSACGLEGGALACIEGAGLLSKKLPPEGKLGDTTEGWREVLEEPKFENGAGFAACCSGAGEEKLRLPNASPNPPKEGCEACALGVCEDCDENPARELLDV